ncbi:hypothetical protein SAG0066_01230 [Streptococcus agalactiae CCUG 38383]|nr:hypothetical protein SAG0066_01230 [Streptococcus agalactiae CCUG 38383]
MKKQFLKSAAILSLAVTAVSTSQPVAGITKDYNNRNEKVKKYLQEIRYKAMEKSLIFVIYWILLNI